LAGILRAVSATGQTRAVAAGEELSPPAPGCGEGVAVSPRDGTLTAPATPRDGTLTAPATTQEETLTDTASSQDGALTAPAMPQDGGSTADGASDRSPLDSRSAPPAADATRVRARLGIAGLVGSVALIAIGAARTGVLLPQSVRPVPAPLGGAFNAISLDLTPGGVIALLAVMMACYAAVVAGAARLGARTLIGAIVLANLLVLLAPPLVSTDIFSYQAYARMGSVYSINPYTHGPYAINLDPVFPYIGYRWSYVPSVYGPLFTLASYPLAALSVAASVFAYKALAAASSLALVAIVWRCARLRDRDVLRAVALVGLNPLLVIYGVGGGHNDLVMLVAMAAALWALLVERDAAGGALGALAVGLKLTAGVILPFACVDRARRGAGRWQRLWAGLGAGAGVVLAAGFSAFGAGLLEMFATLDHAQAQGGDASFPGFVAARLGLPGVGHAAGFALAGVFALVCLWLMRRVWRGRLDWIDAAAWATVAMLLATGSLLPWYVSWLAPLAALARDRRLTRATLALTAAVLCIQMISYVPHYSPLF